jgi:hypothetical protein
MKKLLIAVLLFSAIPCLSAEKSKFTHQHLAVVTDYICAQLLQEEHPHKLDVYFYLLKNFKHEKSQALLPLYHQRFLPLGHVDPHPKQCALYLSNLQLEAVEIDLQAELEILQFIQEQAIADGRNKVAEFISQNKTRLFNSR